jgi:hypothetical protein
MKRVWPTGAKILTGLFVTAVCAMPQNYTISAKPGVVNYVDGNVFLDGRAISPQNIKATFVNANETISTDIGKAEVLLSPGVFLRLGDNSRVRMVSPSLTDTQLEVKAGEVMIEADDIVKDSQVTVLDHGNSVLIDRNGLYRFTAGDSAKVAVLEGKANVLNGDRKTEIGKGHEVLLADGALKSKKFDAKAADELYAWSNVRSEYNAASSYQAAQDVNASSYGGVWGGYGFSGFSNPGWFWNSGFNSWAWLPGSGAYYSPFGYGFYSPLAVGYAPVMYAPIYGGGGGGWNRRAQLPTRAAGTINGGKVAPVPVNAAHPPALGAHISSPMANQAARAQSLHSFSSTGFRTANGMTVPAGRASFGGASAPAGGGRASYGGGRASYGGAHASPGAAGANYGGAAHAGMAAGSVGGASHGGAPAGGGGAAHR